MNTCIRTKRCSSCGVTAPFNWNPYAWYKRYLAHCMSCSLTGRQVVFYDLPSSKQCNSRSISIDNDRPRSKTYTTWRQIVSILFQRKLSSSATLDSIYSKTLQFLFNWAIDISGDIFRACGCAAAPGFSSTQFLKQQAALCDNKPPLALIGGLADVNRDCRRC